MRTRILLALILVTAVTLAVAEPARADNCSGFSDCSTGAKVGIVALGILAVGVGGWLIGGVLVRGAAAAAFREAAKAAMARAAVANAVAAGAAPVGFASQKLLLQHFAKHAHKFGYRTIEQYLAGARNLIRNPGVLTHVRANGDRLFYNGATNEFAVVTRDGFFRTYFPPDAKSYPHGLYWLRDAWGIKW